MADRFLSFAGRIFFLAFASLPSLLPLAHAEKRVIVLGFDGADPVLLEQWMDSGDLPHLARLRETGCYARLATTNPAESPVSWASFETGCNPGKTDIFDFLKRRPGTYFPEIALIGVESRPFLEGTKWARWATWGLPAICGLFLGLLPKLCRRRPPVVALFTLLGVTLGFGLGGWVCAALPAKITVPVSLRCGETFWEILGRNGIPCTVLNAPLCFPAQPFPHGKLLSGLGTPDLRQTWGAFSCFRDDIKRDEPTETGGKWIRVEFSGARALTAIPGPRNPFLDRHEELSIPLHIERDSARGSVRIEAQGQAQMLRPGEWSKFFEFSFAFHSLLSVHGIARFCLLSATEPFQLYLSPIQLHPKRPPPTAAISYPHDFAAELAGHLGLFETLGWAIPTNPLKDDTLDEPAFLENLKFTEGNRRRMLFYGLEQPGWRCLVAIFMGPDRIQHMFWRFIDPEHSRYDAEEARKFAGCILDVYREMDDIVGKTLETHAGADTTLLVLSDHGFHSFRKGVNINTWLVKNGYMALTPGCGEVYMRLEDLFDDRAGFFKNVDWQGTKAYSLGLGKIYLNVAGREPQGRVHPGEEYEMVRDDIIQKFLELRDPDTGCKVVRRCFKREEIYRGRYQEHPADIVVGFEPGYRVSWQTALGGVPGEVVEENRSKWSGDHCSVDPELTPGVFFCNRRFQTAKPGVMDIAPTVLHEFGLEPPEEMDGRPLVFTP